MKILIVYYSRTGITRRAAETLKDILGEGADLEEIHEPRDRDGMGGWLSAGRDATLKKATPIEPSDRDAGEYDLVVIGTPVWAFTMASAVRTWLTENAGKLKQVAFYCTMGGSGDKRTFQHMQQLAGRPPVAELALIDRDVKAGRHEPAVEEFARTITGQAAHA